MTKNVPHCQGKHLSTSQARRTHMTSMTHPSVEIQTSPLAVPALPHWFGEVSLVAQYLTHLGVREALSQRVRLARGRMGTSDVIDFVALLIGYALSGERTLHTFSERILPFASPFMALFGREHLPHRSSLSRFLASLDQSTVEALRTLFLEDLGARALAGGEQRGLWDRCGKPWHVFDVDGTRAVARQRALPRSPDLPAPKRRLEEVCAPAYRGHKRGEVVRTRTVVQEASTHRLLGTFSGAGNGDYRGELSRALGTLRTYLAEQPLALSRVIVRAWTGSMVMGSWSAMWTSSAWAGSREAGTMACWIGHRCKQDFPCPPSSSISSTAVGSPASSSIVRRSCSPRRARARGSSSPGMCPPRPAHRWASCARVRSMNWFTPPCRRRPSCPAMCSICTLGAAALKVAWPTKIRKRMPTAGVRGRRGAKNVGRSWPNGCGTCAWN